MLKIINDDIFKSNTEAIINTVNTIGVMGKGLALAFKKEYPQMFNEYVKICKSKDFYIGRLFIYQPKSNESNLKFKYIINFPTKTHWRYPSKLEYIQTGLKVLVKKIDQLGIKSIAVPALGCSNGKLKWEDVLELIIKEMFEVYQRNDTKVILYKPYN